MNLIFSPYFTQNRNFSQHDSSHNQKGGSRPDCYYLIKEWYESVMDNNLKAIIFHNECSSEFIEKYSNSNISFVYYNKLNRPSYNDERFYCYVKYLINHPEVENIFCTDIFDVKFFNDPFKLLSNEYSLYVGSEIPSWGWMDRKFREVKLEKLPRTKMVYNAGIVGGNREDILLFFNLMIDYFSNIDKNINANMGVFNHCLRRVWKEKVFTGFPLHSTFKGRQHKIPFEKGSYIKHK